MNLTLVDFAALTPLQLATAAGVLRDALWRAPSGYQGPGEAEAMVDERLADRDWFGFAALDDEAVAGWTGVIRTYSHAWELHPLAVAPKYQRRSVGSALLARAETRAAEEGALTLYLGTDDEYGGTNLFRRDLFSGVLTAVAALEPVGPGHSFTFYRRHGYQVVGVIPDANGSGCPDIFMVKRLA